MVFFLFILLFSCGLDAGPVVGAYYDRATVNRGVMEGKEKFSLDKIPPNLLTDFYFAFVVFDGSYQFTVSEEDKIAFEMLQNLKKRSEKLNLFASFGGWGFNDPVEGENTYRLFSQLVASKESRAQWIQGVIAFIKAYGFQGIALDWEYPGDLTRGGQEQDFDNFISLLKELKAHAPDILIAAAFPAAIPQGLPSSYHKDPSFFYRWIRSCTPYLDQIHVMTYDYHIPEDYPKITGVNAPLPRDTDPKSYLFIEHSIRTYLDHDIPKDKILLGIPLFGRSYAGVKNLSKENPFPGKPFQSSSAPTVFTRTPGMLAYYEIADSIEKKMFQFTLDPVTKTAIAYDIAKEQWVSFDTPETIELKGEFARKQQLQGIFFWSLDQDEYYKAPRFPCVTSGKSSLIPFQ